MKVRNYLGLSLLNTIHFKCRVIYFITPLGRIFDVDFKECFRISNI